MECHALVSLVCYVLSDRGLLTVCPSLEEAKRYAAHYLGVEATEVADDHGYVHGTSRPSCLVDSSKVVENESGYRRVDMSKVKSVKLERTNLAAFGLTPAESMDLTTKRVVPGHYYVQDVAYTDGEGKTSPRFEIFKHVGYRNRTEWSVKDNKAKCGLGYSYNSKQEALRAVRACLRYEANARAMAEVFSYHDARSRMY